MVRKIGAGTGTINKINEVKEELEEIREKYIKTKQANSRLHSKITSLENKIERLQKINSDLKSKLDGSFSEKATRTEKKIIEEIEKAKKNNEKITISEIANRTEISRQQLYRKYKHLISNI